MTCQKPFKSALKFLFALFALLGATHASYAQSNLALGGWRLHVPYQQSKAVADAGNKVYVAAEQGLFYFDKEFNTTQTISKVDGLSEQQISTIVFDKETKTLVIAYKNTKIDLIQNGRIISINDVFRKSISGEKVINDVTVYNKLAFITSSFGVIVLDLIKHEIRDTYSNLGPNGENVNVRAAAVLRDSIYVTTNLGVLASKYLNTNLQDYRNWQTINSGLPADVNASKLAVFENKLYVPPYKLLSATISSPASATFRIEKAIAAIPEDNATAAVPPSSSATRCSNTSTVGFMMRE